MPQNTILASGTTAGTSTDVVVAAGSQVNVGIFAASDLPADAVAVVFMDTPGGDVEIARLTRAMPAIAVAGPGTFRATRPAGISAATGIFSET